MTRSLLLEKLREYTNVKENEVVELNVPCEGYTLKKVRDTLIKISLILEEDEENSVYVCQIKAGFAKMNKAYIAICLENDQLHILAYAREGLIKQDTSNEALVILGSELGIELVKKNKNKREWYYVVIVLLLIMCVIGGYFYEEKIYSSVEATAKYNKEVISLNEVIDEYNAISSKLSLESIDGLSSSIDHVNEVSENVLSIYKSVLSGNSTEKINKDIDTIKEIKESLSKEIKILKQINNPSSDWVIERLLKVDGIDEAVAVSKYTDVNGLLNKKNGGYTACIYFSLKGIDQNLIHGDGLVNKGTDAGGAIEVYQTKEDALARCEYLAGFDNTILYSGSYTAVGTMVIRTSYLLDNNQQYSLTNNIICEFTKK